MNSEVVDKLTLARDRIEKMIAQVESGSDWSRIHKNTKFAIYLIKSAVTSLIISNFLKKKKIKELIKLYKYVY